MFDDTRATQTRPRFYLPSERRGTTLISNTQFPHRHCRESHPGPLAWEASILPTELHPQTNNYTYTHTAYTNTHS